MVLQRAPSQSAVYGWVGPVTDAQQETSVTVTVDDGKSSYFVQAQIEDGTGKWKALLKPEEKGGNYTITATCHSGCSGSANITDVTFGDVWYCAGQSNMWLPMMYTYHRNESY